MRLDTDKNILDAAQLTLHTLKTEATVRERLADFGLSAERVEEGSRLWQEAVRRQQTQEQHYNTRWALGEQIREQLAAVQEQFRDHVRIARIAFRKDPITLHALRIKRIAPKGWPCVQQAEYFYRVIQIHELSLEGYQVSQKELQRGATETVALLNMRMERMRLKAQAQHSTDMKNRALRALRGWVVESRSIARLALKNDPQLLESLGLVAPSAVH